jgi:hypothetical protein
LGVPDKRFILSIVKTQKNRQLFKAKSTFPPRKTCFYDAYQPSQPPGPAKQLPKKPRQLFPIDQLVTNVRPENAQKCAAHILNSLTFSQREQLRGRSNRER